MRVLVALGFLAAASASRLAWKVLPLPAPPRSNCARTPLLLTFFFPWGGTLTRRRSHHTISVPWTGITVSGSTAEGFCGEVIPCADAM